MKALVLLAMFMGQMLTGNYRKTVGTTVIVNTVFNEGANFAPIAGTSPVVNVHGNLWVVWPSQASLEFDTGGAVATGSAGNLLNTGAASYTVTFSGLTNTATQIVAFSMLNTTANDRIDVWMLGSGGIALKETVSGTTTQLQTQAVANGATGSIVAAVHGTSITVTAFGQAPMLYTIPSGHGDIGGQYVAMLASTFGYQFGGVNVTVP